MPNFCETGHAKNLANYFDLIACLPKLGEGYNPPGTELSIEALTAAGKRATAAHNDVTSIEIDLRQLVATRNLVFTEMQSTSKRVRDFLLILKTDERTINAAKSLVGKINGYSKSKSKTDEGAGIATLTEVNADGESSTDKNTRSISTAQLSFDMRCENFGKLVMLVEQHPSYECNEAALQAKTLRQQYNGIFEANRNVYSAEHDIEKARLLRNDLLYGNSDCICNLASNIKTYIKAAFGSASREYEMVKSYEIKRIRV